MSCKLPDTSVEACIVLCVRSVWISGMSFPVAVVISLSLFSRETPVLFRYYFCYLSLSLSSFFWSKKWCQSGFKNGPLNARQAFCYIPFPSPFIAARGFQGTMVASLGTDPGDFAILQ